MEIVRTTGARALLLKKYVQYCCFCAVSPMKWNFQKVDRYASCAKFSWRYRQGRVSTNHWNYPHHNLAQDLSLGLTCPLIHHLPSSRTILSRADTLLTTITVLIIVWLWFYLSIWSVLSFIIRQVLWRYCQGRVLYCQTRLVSFWWWHLPCWLKWVWHSNDPAVYRMKLDSDLAIAKDELSQVFQILVHKRCSKQSRVMKNNVLKILQPVKTHN